MPYLIRKARGKQLYWVMNAESGRKYSKSPIPLARAESQRRALYAVENGYVLRKSSRSRRSTRSRRT